MISNYKIFNNYKKIVFLFLFSISFSCSKYFDTTWVYYNETQCSDKWGTYKNNEDLKEKITSYFKSKDVSVYDVDFLIVSTPATCLSCTCVTGKKIKLKIIKNNLSTLQEEGFYE